MTDFIPALLIIVIPVCAVAIVAIGLCLNSMAKMSRCLVETNAMLQYNNRCVVDAIVTPPGDQIPRIEAEASSTAKRVPKSPWPAPVSDRLYNPIADMDDLEDTIGGDV